VCLCVCPCVCVFVFVYVFVFHLILQTGPTYRIRPATRAPSVTCSLQPARPPKNPTATLNDTRINTRTSPRDFIPKNHRNPLENQIFGFAVVESMVARDASKEPTPEKEVILGFVTVEQLA